MSQLRTFTGGAGEAACPDLMEPLLMRRQHFLAKMR
jgi:hypothetical protein